VLMRFWPLQSFVAEVRAKSDARDILERRIAVVGYDIVEEDLGLDKKE